MFRNESLIHIESNTLDTTALKMIHNVIGDVDTVSFTGLD